MPWGRVIVSYGKPASYLFVCASSLRSRTLFRLVFIILNFSLENLSLTLYTRSVPHHRNNTQLGLRFYLYSASLFLRVVTNLYHGDLAYPRPEVKEGVKVQQDG